MNSRVVGLVGRGARALVLEVERAPVFGRGTKSVCHAAGFLERYRRHNWLYEPRTFYARKGMLHRFSFVNLSKGS